VVVVVVMWEERRPNLLLSLFGRDSSDGVDLDRIAIERWVGERREVSEQKKEMTSLSPPKSWVWVGTHLSLLHPLVLHSLVLVCGGDGRGSS